ncbi:unnamed protein product [Phytomonas sp. Hart1]|nr:unnamed protein product [Phytomonas sp. Hart1]|eukprot:CCW67116.1 unnamed protein product [Phytomonas sp. isolate Hart1]
MKAQFNYTILFILLWLLCSIDCALSAELNELPQGGWKLRVLSPGYSPPPPYAVWVDGDSINITKLNTSGLDKFFSRAVGLLQMLNLRTYRESNETFHLKKAFSHSLFATKKGDNIDVYCNSGLLDGMNLSQLLNENGFFSKSFGDALPIHMIYDDQCTALPWGIEHISVHYQSSSQKIQYFTFAFVLRERESNKIRVVVVEATPFTREKPKREGSLYGPLGAIIVLSMLRALPRYFMKRNSRIGKGCSYRSRVFSISESERRKLMKEKCEKIISDMKTQDDKS